jgi:hypothetical protein
VDDAHEPSAEQRARGREHVVQRVEPRGRDRLAALRAALAQDDQEQAELERELRPEHARDGRVDHRARPRDERSHGRARDLDRQHEREHRRDERPDRLGALVAEGVVRVARLRRDAHRDEQDDADREVHQRVGALREHELAAGQVPDDEVGRAERDVQAEREGDDAARGHFRFSRAVST